ncbi:uncharacterized protein LOC111274205 [Durio zibethinus]|uniref:Uncharacterized protein LOC111274205 n=1 Tax=Durio zibethinus TaxID=66656 RepID=A0A6P5WES2_DURZI|nr:uncharacterized protein LOC111274205 [Durio zibethinus]
MEAALCLGYGPFLSISLRMPSSTSTTPASTKLHFGFNHSSISVSSGFMTNRRRCHHFFSSRPLALDRSNSSMPSANEKDGGKVVRGAVGASLALACALSIIGCRCKMNLKAIAGPKQQVYQKAPSFQQFAPPAPRKMALKSLLDVTVNLASKEVRRARDVSPGTLPPPSRHLPPSKDQIDQLKNYLSKGGKKRTSKYANSITTVVTLTHLKRLGTKEAVSLMKRGQPDQALSMLKNEYKKYEMSGPETAYYMNMVLVEILICQGKYEEAFEFMSAYDQKISDFDVRPTLYKAILCTMLDRDEEGQQLWEEFARSIGGFSP